MKKLWDQVESNIRKRQAAFYIFLFANTFLWTAVPFLIVLAGCVLFGIKMMPAFSAALTVTGFTGMFIGFFGGLLYILRTQKP